MIEALTPAAGAVLVALIGFFGKFYTPSRPTGLRGMFDQTPEGRGRDVLAVQLQIDALEAVRNRTPAARRFRRTRQTSLGMLGMLLLAQIGYAIYLAVTDQAQSTAESRLVSVVIMLLTLIPILLTVVETRAISKDHLYRAVSIEIAMLRRQIINHEPAVRSTKAGHHRDTSGVRRDTQVAKWVRAGFSWGISGWSRVIGRHVRPDRARACDAGSGDVAGS